jgi:ATPase MipZ
MVCREFFPRLTALDICEDTLRQKPNVTHLTARVEVKSAINMLKLPLDDRGVRLSGSRAQANRSTLNTCSPTRRHVLPTKRLLCPLRRLPEATTLWRSF